MAENQTIEIRINADDLDRFENIFKAADSLTIDAVKVLIGWALGNMPPAEVKDAINRVLWWLDMQRKKAVTMEGKVSDANE